MRRKLGDILYLNLQLYDGEARFPLRVFVTLRDDLGNIFEPPFEIFHVGGGMFRDNTKTMPATPFLTAIYTVFEVDGITPNEKYLIAEDVYVRDLEGEIIFTLPIQIANVSSIELEASISDEQLEAEIEKEETISIELNEKILEGVIYEC